MHALVIYGYMLTRIWAWSSAGNNGLNIYTITCFLSLYIVFGEIVFNQFSIFPCRFLYLLVIIRLSQFRRFEDFQYPDGGYDLVPLYEKVYVFQFPDFGQ